MRKVGFIVNPIAGMGGAVGLKGTDGKEALKEAIRRGAKPVSSKRALRFLKEMQRRAMPAEFLIAPGAMGGELATQLKLEHKPIGTIGITTTSEDTTRIARLMKQEKPDLIVFCGGDGTARDILEGVGLGIPVLGVPAGVKIYSSVFAINPVAAAESAADFLEGQIGQRTGEVVDVDEAAYRNNRLSIKLFGHLTTPDSGPLVQTSKSPSGSSEDMDLEAIAEFVIEEMRPDWIYVLGPGSTVDRIARRMRIEKTLLGVDAVKGDGT
ncbi:MAG TPA: NAD(+)/NADH kinase, partial [Candidatus Bathyarchaeia archaeon]|nr:NAD(+)/NADH kinase [Candidatus Bathyarchaeia archaeon]